MPGNPAGGPPRTETRHPRLQVGTRGRRGGREARAGHGGDGRGQGRQVEQVEMRGARLNLNLR